jgi:apolipoprotein N-acyltransferase
MTAALRILGSAWLALVLIVMLLAFGVTWLWRGWSATSSLLYPGSASFVGMLVLSAPGIAPMALARWIECRRHDRR